MLYKITAFGQSVPPKEGESVVYFTEDFDQFQQACYPQAQTAMPIKAADAKRATASLFFSPSGQGGMKEEDNKGTITQKKDFFYENHSFQLETKGNPTYVCVKGKVTLALATFRKEVYLLGRYEFRGGWEEGTSKKAILPRGNPVVQWEHYPAKEGETPFVNDRIKVQAWMMLETHPLGTILDLEQIPQNPSLWGKLMVDLGGFYSKKG